MNRARRISNLEKASEALMKILRVLSDENWHQNSELAEKTGISSATLSKHLKNLRKLKLAQLKVDYESGKYPEPHYYKAEPELVTYSEAKIRTLELSEHIEPSLLESRDPLMLLEIIHLSSEANLELLLRQMKEEKNLSESKMSFLAELFVWEPFIVLSWKLLESTRKIVDEIDFTKLQKDQVKRMKLVTDATIKLMGE
jgi:DNA-binding transcriptional ArsR family regulator